MKSQQRIRRLIAAIIVLIIGAATLLQHPELQQVRPSEQSAEVQLPQSENPRGEAATMLEALEVKGRAPKTNYSRSQFGDGWAQKNGCDMRNIILSRDLKETRTNDECQIVSGVLNDPYTGSTVQFTRGASTSADVQIDHVVALSDAWQKGAQQLSAERREQFANDPLELLAVDGAANQQKSDGDAATWLPRNKPFRCQYVARQIAVKHKYELWVAPAEKKAMQQVLVQCPGQLVP